MTGPLVAALAVLLAVPASAQTRNWDVPLGGLARNDAECMAQFRAADQNGDGFLNAREMSDARGLLPTDLSIAGELVSRHEFLSACRAGASEGQRGAG
jgi:hypothetical protein